MPLLLVTAFIGQLVSTAEVEVADFEVDVDLEFPDVVEVFIFVLEAFAFEFAAEDCAIPSPTLAGSPALAY